MPPKQIDLHDGDGAITSIGVIMLLRNNATYIRKYLLTGVFDRLQQLYPSCDFVYYMCENDSADETPELLPKVVKGRKAHIFSEHIDHPYDETPKDYQYDRIARMSLIRNHFMQKIKQTPTFHEHQWILFIDSDIFFDEMVLDTLFRHCPKKNNIGVLTCKTLELYEEDGSIYSANHYYDTFAFIDAHDHLSYPRCVMTNCEMCKNTRVPNTQVIDPNDTPAVVDVRSAWAGFVLIDASVFVNPVVRWRTVRMKDEISTCEHIYLCDMITAVTGKRIVLCMDAECYMHKRIQ